MKSNYFWGGLIILIIAASAFAFLRKNEVGKITEIDLKNYNNSTLGISFEYPDYYLLTERDLGENHKQIMLVEDTDTNRKLLNGEIVGEGPTAITIDAYKVTANITADSWAKSTPASNYQLKKDEAYPISIGGIKGLTYVWDGLYQGQSIVTKHKENILVFSVTYLTNDDKIRMDYGSLVGNAKLE